MRRDAARAATFKEDTRGSSYKLIFAATTANAGKSHNAARASENATIFFARFSSSRMFPGQLCASNFARVSSLTTGALFPSPAYFARK